MGSHLDHVASLLRRADPAELALAAECQAFVTGTFLEHACRSGGSIPAWAWTNALAHGTEGDLDRVSRALDVPDAFDAGDDWWRARAYLAGEVLAVAGRHGPLHRVQSKALVPLELDLASRTSSRCYHAADWVEQVVARLAPFDAWSPRRSVS